MHTHGYRSDVVDSGVARGLGIPTVTTLHGSSKLGGRTVLHCGPPIAWEEMCDPLRRSVRAAVVVEGWAECPAAAGALLDRGDVLLQPANHQRVVVPMATAIGPSSPLQVVDNIAGGTRAFSPINQGPGDAPWFGMDSPAAIERLRMVRDVVGPVLAAVVRSAGPIDLTSLAGQGVQMGDDVHVRVQATTNLLVRQLLPHLAAVEGPERVETARDAVFERWSGPLGDELARWASSRIRVARPGHRV